MFDSSSLDVFQVRKACKCGNCVLEIHASTLWISVRCLISEFRVVNPVNSVLKSKHML